MAGWNIFQLDHDYESVTIAWDPVPDAVAYEIQMLERSEEGGIDWSVLSSTFKNNFLRKKNLRPGIGYQFRLRSQNSNGDWTKTSTASDAFYVLNPDTLVMAPPTFLESDGGSITIQWEEVADVDGYYLRWRREEDRQWTNVDSLIHGTNAKKKSLGPGNYYFAVMPATTDGRNWSYSAAGGPFKVASLHVNIARYLPATLLSKAKSAIPSTQHSASVLGGKVIAFYFSAHWCGPCRNFTPQLAQFYQHVVQGNPHIKSHFEVVFCSADHSADDFDGYYREMPWAAIPYDEDAREQLMSMFKVNGIPRLMIIGTEGQMLVSNAIGTPLTLQTVESWIAMNKQPHK